MFEFVKDWYESFEQESGKIIDSIREACRYIFRKEHMMVSYTGKEKEPSFLEDAVHKFSARMFTASHQRGDKNSSGEKGGGLRYGGRCPVCGLCRKFC